MGPALLFVRDIDLAFLLKAEVYCSLLDHSNQECPQCHLSQFWGEG